MSPRIKALAGALAIAVPCGVAVAPAQAATGSAKKLTVKSVNRKVNALGKEVGSISATLKGLKAIADAAPTIVNGLTQLKDGLTKLGDAYQAVEYGAIALYGDNNTDPVGGIRPNTPDIPDDGNLALVSGTVVTGNPNAGASVKLNLRGAIRSAEADGQSDTGPPAGQGGGSLIATCASNPCGPLALGSLLAACQTPANTFSLPDGTSTSQHLVSIQRAQARTAVDTPSNKLVENGGTGTDLRLIGTDGNPCNLPALGAAYNAIVTVQAAFADIPDSTSPGPKD